MLVPVVVGNAAVQAALVAGNPAPLPSPVFVLAVVASFVVLVLAVAFTITAPRLPRTRVLLSSTAAVLAVVGFSLLTPLLVPVGVALVLLVLPAAAVGRPLSGFVVFRRGPVRTVLAVIAAMALVVLGWVVALLLGFFVTGVVASALTWLCFGVTGVVLITWFGLRYRRALA